MKQYKTNQELLEYLISKNVIIKDEKKALEYIERYSYYSIINGYKDAFKDKTNEYKPNVTFEEIYALYEFDKNIRAILLKYILEIEIIVKSLLANTIAEKYGMNNYLEASNFDNSENKENKEKLVNDLILNINKEVQENYIKHDAVTHYKDTYGFVPPFVLTKILTFGVISRYYGLLKQKDRQNISKYFKISDKLLKEVLINLTVVRNKAAHSDRIFCYHSKYYIRFKEIEKSYKKGKNYTNIYMIIRCMENMLDEEKAKNLKKEFDIEVKKLEEKLNSISINDILRIMGFNVLK